MNDMSRSFDPKLIDEARARRLADPDELHEALREECAEEFDEWRGRDWRNREDADFGAWLARMAQPHMVDHARYREAMNYSERKAAGLLPVVGLA